MYEFDTKFGIWTNGTDLVAVINTTDNTVPGQPIRNELTFSPIQDIREENLIYQGLAGLCLASVEYAQLPNAEAKLQFMNQLCPPESRQAPGHVQPFFNYQDSD